MALSAGELMRVPRATLSIGVVALCCLMAMSAWGDAPPIHAWQVGPGTSGVLVEDHRVPLVSVVIEFPVGSWSAWVLENPGWEAFEIQLYDPEGDLRERADRLATDLSVYMWSHAARISASCRKEDLTEVIGLIRDVLANQRFDRALIKRWSKAESFDWSAARKRPEFRLGQAVAGLFYEKGDPRRREFEKPRGNETDTKRLIASRDTVIRLPGRVVGFAGDLSADRAERLAADLLPAALASVPEGLEPRYGPMIPTERIADQQVITMKRITQVFFAYARESLTHDDPRYPAFMIADHVLGGHSLSRINEALRHEGGETYGAYTRGKGGVYREAYALTSYTRAGNARVMEEKLREVLRRFHEEGIGEAEREIAASYLRGHRLLARQSPAQILDRYLWEQRNGYPHGWYEELVERAAGVSLSEVNALIREFYDPAEFRMIRVAPD